MRGDNVVELSAPRKRESPMKGKKLNPAQAAVAAAARAKRKERTDAARVAREAGVQTRFQLYKQGKLHISDMTDDELAKQKWMDRGGGFGGHSQTFPAIAFRQIRQEILRRGDARIQGRALSMLDAMYQMAMNPAVPEAVRLKAICAYIDRAFGRVPERLLVTADNKWEDAMERIIADYAESV